MANKNFKVRHGLEVGDNFTVVASSGNTTVGGSLTVSGDLTVNGNTTQINTDVLNVEDNEITLNSNVTGSALLDANIIVNRGTDPDVSIKWNENTNKWQFTNDGTTFYDFLLTDANTTYTISAETTTGGTNLRLTGSDTSTDNVKLAEGTGITITRTDADTITFASTVVDTNTTYSVSAVDGTTGKKIIRLTGSDSTTDDVTLVEGSGITLSRAGDEITIANTSPGTTYGISAETTTGGTNLRLTGSDATTDNVKFAEGTGITVTRTDADTITFASTVVDTNTTYAISAETTTGGTNLRLTGSDASTDNVKLAEGTGITVTRTDADTITIATTVVDTNTTYAISAETTTGGANLRLTGSDTTTDNVKLSSGTGVTVSRTDADTIDIAIGQAVGTGSTPTFAALNVDSIANIDTATLTTSTTASNQVLDSWSISTYRSAKYQITIAGNSEYQVVEMFVLQDGSGAYQTTYADMRSGSNDLATFSVDINSGNCRVLTTPLNAVTVYKVVRTTIVV